MFSRQRRLPARSGQGLVEMALMLPLITLILVGTVDLGRVFFYYARLTNAVKEGALYGAYAKFDASAGTTAIINRAYKEAGDQLGTPDVDFVIKPDSAPAPGVRCYQKLTTTLKTGPSYPAGDCRNARAGDSLTVTGAYTFRPFTSQIIQVWGVSFPITKTVRMTILSGAVTAEGPATNTP